MLKIAESSAIFFIFMWLFSRDKHRKEKNMKKQNICNVILLVLLAGVIAFFSLSYIFVPAHGFSEDENRVLQTAPRFTLEKLLDGTYTRQLHDYFSDQINLRTKMVELKAFFELAMGKNENNGVLLGKDGYLIETYPYTDENHTFLKNNIKKIDKLAGIFEENGISVTRSVIPRKVDILTDKFPPYYSAERNSSAWEYVGNSYVDLKSALSDAQKTDGSFYKTDHHWTAEGAYAAYRALGADLGYTPLPISHFELYTLSNAFHGTTYSTSGFFFAPAEEIKSPRVDPNRYTTTIVDINYSFDGIIDESYLTKKDKYSAFLSGNNGHVIITDKYDPDKETLIIIKDSYSHSFSPFLLEHYNIELIDPRYYIGSIEEYVLESEAKNVLFLIGLDTLASANLSIR